MSDYRNHSENSLRSNSSSCRFACLAYAIQESKMIPIIVHPINTSSCGMFLGLLSFSLVTTSLDSSKTFFDKRSGKPITCVKNIPHEEVFRVMQIL